MNITKLQDLKHAIEQEIKEAGLTEEKSALIVELDDVNDQLAKYQVLQE